MDEQETIVTPEDTTIGTPDTQAPVEAPEVEEAPVEESPEVVETPVVVPVEEVPEDIVPVLPSTDVDIAPEDVPVVHNDDGSIGRELDHVVEQ